MKEEYGYEWEEVLNTLFKNVELSVDKVMTHIAAVEMARKKIIRNRKRRNMKEAGFSMTGETTLLDDKFKCSSLMESYRNRRNGESYFCTIDAAFFYMLSPTRGHER